jgi:hypothetical protein
MLEALFDKIAEIFGKKNEPEPMPRERKKPRIKQVYEGRCRQKPEWVEGLDHAKIIEACTEHAVCKFHPHIESKRIMSARTGVDGNLEAEYEGIAADCGAVKNFGLKVAKMDGYIDKYRYVDLNHIFSACCDKPRKCPFYLNAIGESQDLNAQQRRL